MQINGDSNQMKYNVYSAAQEKYVPYELYATMLDLIYSGNEKSAWAFLEKAWPTELSHAWRIGFKHKTEFQEDLKSMVCGSLFAHLATVDLRKLGHKYWFLKETCPLLYPEVEEGEVWICEGEGIMINSVGTGFYGTFEKNLQVTGVKWRDIERNHPRTIPVGKPR